MDEAGDSKRLPGAAGRTFRTSAFERPFWVTLVPLLAGRRLTVVVIPDIRREVPALGSSGAINLNPLLEFH